MSTTTTELIGTYTADPVHSSLGFSIPVQSVSLFRGTLGDVEATLVDGRLEGTAAVESISITTPEAFRAHVLSAEFLDAEAHPQLRFVSTAVVIQDGRASVSGNLTIKGITRPVQATGTWIAPVTDAFGNTRANLTLETEIDRREFGMNWNAPLPSGGDALGNTVNLTVSLSLVAES
jgi:polyisoprenoid-binding protein YceI